MHAVKLLHALLDNACDSIDKRLRRTLFSAAEALTRCGQLSITALGRSLDSSAKVKHTIKCVDRLFGNHALHLKRNIFYRAMSHMLLKGNKRPVIIVDWSGLTPCGSFHFLRASVAVNGRAITLYDQAYPLNFLNKDKTHRDFLIMLQSIIPDKCVPIIVTDAGFRNSWFRAVLKMGWNYVGRIRNNTQYNRVGTVSWLPINSLYEGAKNIACYIGDVIVSRSTPLECHFYLKKNNKKYRVKRNLAGKKVRSSYSKKHEKGGREPWLIASSISPTEMNASEIMKIYEKRMQIEEAFRDLKNTRNGLGLRHCRSFKTERLNVALLIASLATLVLWILGLAAKNKNLHYSYQSNTEKQRNILSCFTIGRQVLLRDENQFTKGELMAALKCIIATTATAFRVSYAK
jgi:hypothetical protein